ncbi:MAG: GH116 family glycosyl-hydrolase [Halanaerobiales bacterium]
MEEGKKNRQMSYKNKGQRIYPGEASEAAFLLGGIGTGNISIGSRGNFQDWEIFNRPAKENNIPYSFFSIRTIEGKNKPICKVIEAKLNPPYSRSHGFIPGTVAGLPRFDSSKMRGEYPFVRVDFEDQQLPVKVELEAFTPFIPLNADDSGIPGIIIRYKAKNTSDEQVEVSIAGTMNNVVGFQGYNVWKLMELKSNLKNEFIKKEEYKGIYYTAPDIPADDLLFGNMALMTREEKATAKPEWLKGDWWVDGPQDFWDDLKEDGLLELKSDYEGIRDELHKGNDNVQPKTGSLAVMKRLEPGEEKVFEFTLNWYFPNRIKDWNEDCCSDDSCCSSSNEKKTRNYYSTLFDDAWQVGEYLYDNMDRLEGLSRNFHAALFNSSLPEYIIDAAASNITVLRSTTCFRLEDGTFLGYEGCHDNNGCCPGNCTHVWNFAQTNAFLFPELEKTMRRVEFELETEDDGFMEFRSERIMGNERDGFIPAVDGQMGTIIRLYREWKISGDDNLIEELWDKASKALDFAFSYWDHDGDYVLEAKQHVGYDIEFYGPNPLGSSMYLAALKAGMEISKYLGDRKHYNKYKEALGKATPMVDKLLWNGEYYIQKLEDINKYRYQHGEGCLSDQLLGQSLAHITGLGYVLPEEHVRKAVYSIFKYNFRESMADHESVQRTYVLNDEAGLLLCSWPNGQRPKIPFVYSDEVWNGIEYMVASLLIYEGYIDEALTIVKAARGRYDGYKRNPWDEVECGHHYVRSMSSWALLIALSGYKVDMVKGTISFDPVINREDFSTFWSNGKAWGVYKERYNEVTGHRDWNIEVLYGSLEGISVNKAPETGHLA